MLLLFHISAALLSLAVTAFTFFAPSKARLYLSQILIATTLFSGTFVVFSHHANMVSACVSGLIYTGVVSLGLVGAHRKLAAQQAQ